MMRKILSILLIACIMFGCNNDTPNVPTTQYVIVLNGNSFQMTQEAYENLVYFLNFLRNSLSGVENKENIISQIERILGDEFQNSSYNDEVIDAEELEADILTISNSEEISNESNLPDINGILRAPLTIMAYLVANNNLDDDLYVNVAAMCQGLSLMDQPATLLVYWDGKSGVGNNGATHAILKFKTDGKGNVNGQPSMIESTDLLQIMSVAEVVKEYSSQLSTSEQVMTTVLKDMVALSPTDRIGLICGSHGSAWTNSIFTSRSFGQDGSGTDNTILLPQMVSAIKSTGKKLDFLLFDSCYMGTMEVCYDFKDIVNYQIVSAMEVPAYGFPYNTELLPYLYQGTPEGYSKACAEFVSYYKEVYTTGNQAWATIAVVDSKEVSAMTSVLKEEIVEHRDALTNFNTANIQEYGKSTAPDIAVDMRHFVKELNDGAVPTEFDAQLNKTVLYKGCMETARPSNYGVDVENYCGLGIYVPVSNRKKWNDHFKTIDWYTASGWNEVTFSWDLFPID